MIRKFKIQLNTVEPLPQPFPPKTRTLEQRFHMVIKESTNIEDIDNTIRENLYSFIEEHRIGIGDTIKVIEEN